MESDENKRDMSMEDILSSIRRYVTDGQTPVKDDLATPKRDSPVIELTDEVLSIESVELKRADFSDLRKDLAFDDEIITERNLRPPPDERNGDLYRGSFGEPQSAGERASDSFEIDDPLFPNPKTAPRINATAPKRETNPFERLEMEAKAAGDYPRQDPSVNDLLGQMATPLVKSWLDRNLRAIVEEAVEREVRRIRKGL